MKVLGIPILEKKDILEISIPTLKMIRNLPIEVVSCGEWWWLQSPGCLQYLVAYVANDGSIMEGGARVYDDENTIRPCFKLKCPLKSEYVMIANEICIKVSEDTYLFPKCVCQHHFDSESNIYETSELKAFIESKEFEKFLFKKA